MTYWVVIAFAVGALVGALLMREYASTRPLKDHECEDVAEFQFKFDHLVFEEPVHLTKRKLQERADLLHEEVNEFVEAAASQDLVEMADALVDIVYIAKGTANMLGLRHAWVELWTHVHMSNLAKRRGIGKRGHKVDVIKPPWWLPPTLGIKRTLQLYGYRRIDWTTDGVNIDETVCEDDDEHKAK